ncbi:MAG: hypothetical protein IPJ03_15390 [Ignavibacteriales bacterium]|nr:hypothetical protein [Ignavibacteriales bacterium]
MITPELLRQLLDFDQLYVGDAGFADDAGTFSDIWSDNVVIAYVPQQLADLPRSYYEPAFATHYRKKQSNHRYL